MPFLRSTPLPVVEAKSRPKPVPVVVDGECLHGLPVEWCALCTPPLPRANEEADDWRCRHRVNWQNCWECNRRKMKAEFKRMEIR